MLIQIGVFVLAVAVMVGGSYLFMRKQSSAGVEEDVDSEPDFPTLVAATRAANPGLSLEPGSARSPEFFWVKERASGRQAQVPSGELAGAKIRFVDCDLGRVAPGLMYPNRTETTCLELRNDKHAMSVYAFNSNDDLEHLLAFYELNVTPEYRLGLYKGRKETRVTRTRRRELTHEFIVSYMLWAGGGFVGYREQKAVTVSDASTPRPCELTFRTGSNVPTRDCTEQPKQSEGEKARTMELLREPLKPRVQPAVAGG